jgi:hypothetical protein
MIPFYSRFARIEIGFGRKIACRVYRMESANTARRSILFYTDRRFLPFALLLLMILRPCFVDIRFRNPWVLARLMRLG